jgi:hypothetical protein
VGSDQGQPRGRLPYPAPYSSKSRAGPPLACGFTAGLAELEPATPGPPAVGRGFAHVRPKPSVQLKRHTEQRRTGPNDLGRGPMVVKMVVKDRCPHLRGPPVSSSESVVTERGCDEGGCRLPLPHHREAVAGSIPRPPVGALLVPRSHRGPPRFATVHSVQVRGLRRSPASGPVRHRSERVAVLVAVRLLRAGRVVHLSAAPTPTCPLRTWSARANAGGVDE